MIDMPKTADPKTDMIFFRGRNKDESDLIKRMKQMIVNDRMEVPDFILPLVKAEVERRAPSNPQCLLDPEANSGITLSQAQQEHLRPRVIEETCDLCNGKQQDQLGVACGRCDGKGTISVQKAVIT